MREFVLATRYSRGFYLLSGISPDAYHCNGDQNLTTNISLAWKVTCFISVQRIFSLGAFILKTLTSRKPSFNVMCDFAFFEEWKMPHTVAYAQD